LETVSFKLLKSILMDRAANRQDVPGRDIRECYAIEELPVLRQIKSHIFLSSFTDFVVGRKSWQLNDRGLVWPSVVSRDNPMLDPNRPMYLSSQSRH
jgi:hypothetical protein